MAALPLVAELPLAFLRPLLVLQLVMWAFGQFITNLPSNAIVMARVSGKDLSNVAAFTGMLSQVGMLLSSLQQFHHSDPPVGWSAYLPSSFHSGIKHAKFDWIHTYFIS